MSEILFEEVPSLDLADFTSGDAERRARFVRQLSEAYQNIGFIALRNHGLSDALTQKLYAATKAFFALPDEVKQQYEVPGLAGQRGYVGKGKEHAKGRNTGDLKEFYHVGQEVTDNDPIKDDYPENISGQDYLEKPLAIYTPKNAGLESRIVERLARWRELKARLKP